MIEQPSLVEMASAEIKKLIVAGALSPGERIFEPRLAEQLGISRPPLREALRALAAQDILTQTPRRGYHVVELSDVDVDEIYSFRAALERMALDLLVPQLPDLSLSDLEDTVKAMWLAADEGDEAGVVIANRAFHEELVALAGHRRLLRSYRSLMDQMQLCMSRNLRTEAQTVGDLAAGCRRHDVLVEALRSGDRARIDAAVKAHGERTYLPPDGEGP
ncbi:GntR family transcriptional regulator [Pseudonocardia sp. WMMC193]|uniref:GntR family transcriptional regulator n=1 Tax=Pseudonocardia sp. WMMC193 TaxID=2911965 RepID=UPI001F28DD38|nr:GntR family transcriptional regulator [Pseudonocardia sp. WMMC193]MCF7552728.1 GntR family transcriptional regulator [Pseudonocardia sp. WMMC193]